MAANALVLAAGRGARFAAAAPQAPFKLLTLVDGLPMIRRTVSSLLDGGAHSCVVVVSSEHRADLETALAGLAVRFIENPDPARGMFSSVQVGLAAVGDDDFCLVMPGDMPFVKASTVAAVLAEAERRGLTVAASHAGVRGHPLALSPLLRRRVLEAPVSSMLRHELAHETTLCIDVDDPGVHRDVDAPADLAGLASRRQLNLLAAALNAAANGVVITDRHGVIEWVNEAVLTLTGYTRDECLGRTPGDLLKSGEHDDQFYADLWQTITSGRVWHGEMINRRKDGSTYAEEMTVTPVRDESGPITHFIAVKTDVSRRKQMERELAQGQRLESVGRLAGGIAHDFNNLLTVINGYTEMALSDLSDDHPLRDSLQEVHRSGLRAADLTRQLLTFSRRRPKRPVMMDVNAVVSDMDRMLRRLIGEDITLVLGAAPSRGLVPADPGQVEQVIMNLAVNARDAMPRGGRLTIQTDDVEVSPMFADRHPPLTAGPYVRLTVSDTGIGMSDEVKNRLFEPFFTTKGAGKGTGLGLSTVYGIVTESGGHITVDSQIGEGTSFRVYLPRAPHAP